jgi:HEAT repeat protein
MFETTMRMYAAVLFVVAVASCGGHAKQAVGLYEAGDYAGANRAVDRGLAAHPDDEGLWQMRIRTALALGDAPGVARGYAEHRKRRGDEDVELLRELAVATLRQALASPSVKLKLAAIEAVAAAELQALADDVAERLGDDDDRVAAAAAAAVLRGYPQAPQVASAMLRSDDPEARRLAVEGVGKKVGALARDDLQRLAGGDPDPRVRRTAIRYLGMIKDGDAVELLARQLRHGDESVRAAAASALARIGRGDLAAFGARAAADRALGVRLAAIELLVAARQPAALERLAADADPVIALEAAAAVRQPALVAKALERAAADPHWTARAAALNVARRAAGKATAVALAQRLAADPEVAVRLTAAHVLGSADRRDAAVAIYVAALGGATRLRAAGDLANLGDERGLAALDAMVRDAAASEDDRAAAARAHDGAHRVTPGLVAALADGSGVVRVAAAAALAQAGR